MKVVIDTNVIVSFLLTGGETISSIFDYWEKETFTLLISDGILLEISQVLGRLESKGQVDNFAAMSLLRKLQKDTERVKVSSRVNFSPDKKDNRYLACAKDGQANFLVTGDKKHLLRFRKSEQTKIVSPAEFVERLKNLNYFLV